MTAPDRPAARTGAGSMWAMPLLLALLTIFGLLAALLGTGAWRWASWFALGAPVVVAARHSLRPARR